MPQKLKKSLSILENDTVYKGLYRGDERDFSWLMYHLLPYSDKIKGCELIFPDTVFFEDGVPKVIIRTDKDFCLKGDKQISKLNLQNIYKDFQNLVRERRKDNVGLFRLKYGTSV